MSEIKVKSLTIKGYKTIKSIENFEPKPINILIGPNGAGKSNFISFFRPARVFRQETLRKIIISSPAASKNKFCPSLQKS